MNLRLKKVNKANNKIPKTFRMTKVEWNNVKQKALVHTDGNMSEWIRYAAQNCTPRRGDFESDK